MLKNRLLILALSICAHLWGLSQDCSAPAPLCFQQFDNIISDSTDIGPLAGVDFGCGIAQNGSLYEFTTIGAGAFEVQVNSINCTSTANTEGDSIVVAVFTSTAPSNPCSAPPAMSTLQCDVTDDISVYSGSAITAGEVYYVAVFGDMDADDLSPAQCGYDIQIDGPAVEFYLTVPSDPFQALAGDSVDIVGVGGVDSYAWQGPTGFPPGISPGDAFVAEPTVLPPVIGPNEYTVTGTVGECSVTETVTIVVNPNIVPAQLLTPNDDGINDFWFIPNADDLLIDAKIKVFNRWGQVVFESVGYGDGQEWDGTRSGKLLPAGAYYYIIELNLDTENSEPFTGAINLIY